MLEKYNYKAFSSAVAKLLKTKKTYPTLYSATPQQSIAKAAEAFIAWVSASDPASKVHKNYPRHEYEEKNGEYVRHNSAVSKFRFTHAKKIKMLEAVEEYGVESAAMRAVNISTKILKQLYLEFPTFACDMRDAAQAAADYAEGELYTRAVRGDENCYDIHGNMIIVYDKHGKKYKQTKSDDLLKFYLRAAKSKYNMTNNISATLDVRRVADLSDEQLLDIIKNDPGNTSLAE